MRMVRKQLLPEAKLVHRKLLVGIGLTFIFGLNAHGQSSTSRGRGTEPNASAAQETAATESEQMRKAYGEAQPYMNCTLPQLQRIVPPLEGLKPDKGGLPLESILRRTGEVIEAQLPRMPDLMAKESVAQTDVRDAKSPGAGAFRNAGRGFSGAAGILQQYSLQFGMDEKQLEQSLHLTLVTETPWKDFDYLIVARRSSDGVPVLEESRTDLKSPNGKRLRREQKILHGTGFAYLWLLVASPNLAESDYRLLGQQKMYGRATYVIGFAQSPARVRMAGQVSLAGQTYPLLYQGVAWIDESTFRIVRLRTDLLAPLPSIQLERFSSDLRFEQVDIPGLSLALWLPWQVELIWTQAGQMSGELHLYSKYSMFRASARILPPE
jgi:hypothetical protein